MLHQVQKSPHGSKSGLKVSEFVDQGLKPKLYFIHPKYYKHLKKAALAQAFGQIKMGWFLAD